MSEGLEAGNFDSARPLAAVAPSADDEVPWDTLAQMFEDGQLIPFLGAAASAYSKDQDGGAPPTVTQLIEKLANYSRLRPHCDTVGCQQFKFDLSQLASYYQTCVGRRLNLDQLLQREIANPAFKPNPLHHLLARIARKKPMLIVTTNYDDLLEKAFDQPSDGGSAVPYDVLVTPIENLAYEPEVDNDNDKDKEATGPEYAGGILYWSSASKGEDFTRVKAQTLDLNIKERSVIYKIHGSVPRGNEWPGGYLIAEEDYARFLGRMGPDGIVPGAINRHIIKKTKSGGKSVLYYSILFLGYSMHDWNLRVLLEELHVGRYASNEEKHYAFVLSPDRVEKGLFAKKRVEVYDCNLTRFVQEINTLVP
jgi:hypothetical protein